MNSTILTTTPNFIKNRIAALIACILIVFFALYLTSEGLNTLSIFLILLSFLIFSSLFLIDKYTFLTIDGEKTIFKTGVLSKNISEVKHVDVRNIQVKQGFSDRLLGIGSIAISSSGQSGIEILINGIEDFEEVKNQINLLRNKSINSQKEIDSEIDIPDQIKKLSELKEAGILTEGEFEQKKRELLNKM